MLGTYLGAATAAYVSGVMQLALFALVMLLASWLMLRPLDLAHADRQMRATWKIAVDRLIVGAIGIAGSVIGSKLARRLPQDRLKRWSGYFLIIMGLYILARSAPEALGLTL